MKRFFTDDAKEKGGDMESFQQQADFSRNRVENNQEEERAVPNENKAAEVSSDETDSAGLSPLDQAIIKERYSNEANAKIIGFRTRVDSLYLTAKKLPPSRETSLAITAFQTGRQFTGIMLQEKGVSNPYPKSTDKNSPQIEERADKGQELTEVLSLEGEVPQLKHLRSLAGDLITELSVYLETSHPASPVDFIAQNKVVESVISGKMWLGERLGAIKDAENK